MKTCPGQSQYSPLTLQFIHKLTDIFLDLFSGIHPAHFLNYSSLMQMTVKYMQLNLSSFLILTGIGVLPVFKVNFPTMVCILISSLLCHLSLTFISIFLFMTLSYMSSLCVFGY